MLALTRFAALRVLTLMPHTVRHRADWLAWLFEAPLLRQLERLTLVPATRDQLRQLGDAFVTWGR